MHDIIRAELIGDDTAIALGITARSSTPVIRLCQQLLDAGHDPHTRLHVYRGQTLALTVRSIGEGARLIINSRGTAFNRAREVRTRSLVSRKLKPNVRDVHPSLALPEAR
jgi:hypothetical protein